MHVDDFIDDYHSDPYASFVLMLFRLPAINFTKWREIILKTPLFCTYKGDRYRVTGASRLGDIWLTENSRQYFGYNHRVDIAECSEFSDTFQHNSTKGEL